MFDQRRLVSVALASFVVSGCSVAQDSNALIQAPAESISLRVPAFFPTTTTGCVAVSADRSVDLRDFKRTFFDDFDELDFSWSRWRPHYDGGYDELSQRWLGYDWLVKRTLQGNKEQEIYVDPGYKGAGKVPLGLNPFILHDGVLDITASRTPPELRDVLYGYEFTSGLLTSRASLVQKHGFFEIRAKVPAGKGLWPAFWLLPEDKSWPPEIDVIEVAGHVPDLIASATHWKNPVDGTHRSTGCRTSLPTSTTEYHQYGVLWDERRITYYIDRVPVAEHPTPPGLDKRMYMLLNLAVGGNFVGVADQDTPVPAVFSIDWVAAYAKIK